MSIWEQRTNQLRRHNLRNSSEALFNELEPEERLHMSSALHLRPDMKTHHDRPLVVEHRDGTVDNSRTDRDGDSRECQPTKKPHRCRGENGDAGEGRQHRHHSRNREHQGGLERSSSQDGGHMNHMAGSPEEGSGMEEREHRHHHSRRSRELNGNGNGPIGNGGRGESRVRGHKEGEGGNGERRRHRPRVKAQSTLDGEECRENGGKRRYVLRLYVDCMFF